MSTNEDPRDKLARNGAGSAAYLNPAGDDFESLEAFAARDASLGVGHIWTTVQCPAYRSLDPADCTCRRAD